MRDEQSQSPEEYRQSLLEIERLGCHCVDHWYGDLTFSAVMTCPFHGLSFDDLLENKPPEIIYHEQAARLAAAKAKAKAKADA